MSQCLLKKKSGKNWDFADLWNTPRHLLINSSVYVSVQYPIKTDFLKEYRVGQNERSNIVTILCKIIQIIPTDYYL